MTPCFTFQSFKNHSKKELMNKKTIWLLQAAGVHLQEHCAAAPQHLQAAGPSEFLPPASPWHCPKHLWCHRPHDGALCHSCPGFSAEGQDESQIHSPNFKIKRKDIFLFPSTSTFLSSVPKCEPLCCLFPPSTTSTVADLNQTSALLSQSLHKSCNNSRQ